MKLSEAIRIGASWSKQAFGAYINDDGSTCALGSAVQGVFGDEYNESMRQVRSTPVQFRNLFFKEGEVIENCPICKFRGSLPRIIVDLNDGHMWTREKIADWVEQIEKKYGLTGSEEVKKVLPTPKEVPVA